MKGLLLLAILQHLKVAENQKSNDRSLNGNKIIYFMNRENNKLSDQQKISKHDHHITCVWPINTCSCGVTALKPKL